MFLLFCSCFIYKRKKFWTNYINRRQINVIMILRVSSQTRIWIRLDLKGFALIWSIPWIIFVSIETIALMDFPLWFVVNFQLHTLWMLLSVVSQDAYRRHHPLSYYGMRKSGNSHQKFTNFQHFCTWNTNLSALIASSIPDASIVSGSSLFRFSISGSSLTSFLSVSFKRKGNNRITAISWRDMSQR